MRRASADCLFPPLTFVPTARAASVRKFPSLWSFYKHVRIAIRGCTDDGHIALAAIFQARPP